MLDYVLDYGNVKLTLVDYMAKNKMSKSKLARLADLQYRQLQTYCNNEVESISFDVLARLCFALGCKLSDIMEYNAPLPVARASR